MIFKQIHSLPTSLNWGKIALITVGLFGAAYLTHRVVKHYKVKTVSKPSTDDKTA